ncbi:IMP dehydrogenase, partial [Candidatus Woesearchaeota archaeon]|nr:IMP dehydrogenase [Candidatus Woesearchaeota archaeon]
LLQAGADGEKVGQGPGSICTTRVVAGVGMPQVTAVHECTKELRKEEGGYIVPACADGGIRYPGDVSKAIAAGAHSVMLGSMLAGTDQAPGDVVTHRGRQVKVYRGMGSLEAMQEGSQDRYCQEGVAQDKLVPEGVKGFVPYRGDVAKIVFQMIGGLRQGMGYVGAADIEELRTKANFKRVTPVGRAESHPHDLESFEDAPNYKARS